MERKRQRGKNRKPDRGERSGQKRREKDRRGQKRRGVEDRRLILSA